MGWIRKQLNQRSTYNGLGILSAIMAGTIGPAHAEIVASSLLALYGVYEAIRNEKP